MLRDREDLTLIQELINKLTDDEDYRQELWCFFLKYLDCRLLPPQLAKIKLEQKVLSRFQSLISAFLQNPPSPQLVNILSELSDIESSIVHLLMLGLSPTEISKYKGISQIRILQLITALRKSKVWRQIEKDRRSYVKKESKRR